MQTDNVFLVSVCMITYNHESWIAEAIEGVLMQICDFKLELVIGDDNSTDNTRKIIESYIEKYPNLIKARFNEDNIGMMPNFIKTLKECKGQYVAVCEGDDYWIDSLKLKKQVDLMEQNPACSMCVAKTEWRKDNKVINISGQGSKQFYDFYDVLNNVVYFHTSTYLIRKEFLDVYTSINPVLYFGDTTMRYVLSDMAPLLLLNEVVSVYRITGKGVWSGIGRKKKIYMNIEKFKTFYFHYKPEHKREFLEKLIQKYRQLLVYNIKHFEPLEALSTFFQWAQWKYKLKNFEN